MLPLQKTIRISEWGTMEVPGLAITAEDHRLIEQLNASCHLQVDEFRNAVRITATSWVGVVRFKHFEVHVIPKLAGNNLGLTELLDYVSGMDRLHRYLSKEFHSVSTEGTDLFDLVVWLFTEACERLVRGGLLADYVEFEEDLPVVRGRFLGDRQYVKRFGRLDRLECRYDEHLTDILDNQILSGSLSICGRYVKSPKLALRVRRLEKIFGEACSSADLDFRKAKSLVLYHRMNEAYREPHSLAWLIADGLGISDIYQGHSARCFAFLVDMNRLFEEFLTKWLAWIFRGSQFGVLAQHKDSSILWNSDAHRPYANVIPDIKIQHQGQVHCCVPIDAKYKLYDESKLANADIYQAFLYAFAYGRHMDNKRPIALLVYPASDGNGNQLRLHIRRHTGEIGAEVISAGIHIPSALAEVKAGKEGSVAQTFTRMFTDCVS